MNTVVDNTGTAIPVSSASDLPSGLAAKLLGLDAGGKAVMSTLPVDLLSKTDDALGAGMVGYRGTTLNGQVTLDHRKPRKLFSKLYAAASGPTTLKWMSIGDSLAGFKANHLVPPIDRLFGGVNSARTNTTGNNTIQNASAGYSASLSTNSGVTALSGRYDLWPTGNISEFAAGATAAYIRGGLNPTFTKVRVYYVKEPGAGNISLSVGGTQVATASAANATFDVGYLEYTQDRAQSSVSVAVADATVHVIEVHVSIESASGVDAYPVFAKGGLALSSAMSSAQGRAIFQAYLALVGIDFITFEFDDDFGDGSTNAAAFVALKAILDAAAPLADKLIFASTPRAASDSGKLAASAYLRGQCASANASWLFFDSYYICGSYADMVAIFGADDGVHPNNAVSAFTAAQILQFLGLPIAEMGYLPMPVMAPNAASWFGSGTRFGPVKLSTGLSHYLTVDSNGLIGRWTTDDAFGIGKSDGTTCKFQISYAGSWPTIMPLSCDFDSAGNVRKRDVVTVGLEEFTRLRKTDSISAKQNLDVGMIRPANLTRAQILALPANSMVGVTLFCSDATGGAGLVYAKGASPTDWRRVADDTAI